MRLAAHLETAAAAPRLPLLCPKPLIPRDNPGSDYIPEIFDLLTDG